MGPKVTGRVVVLPIHPSYAKDIIALKKTVELRKRPLPLGVSTVLIYATSPVRSIVGAFSVAQQETLPVAEIWRRFKLDARIGRSDFNAYYSGRQLGAVIHISDVRAPSEPLSLGRDIGVEHAPQNFVYVDSSAAQRVLGTMRAG